MKGVSGLADVGLAGEVDGNDFDFGSGRGSGGG